MTQKTERRELPMKSNYCFVGIDPGLVNTGMVVLRVRTRTRELLVETFVYEGDPEEQVDDLATELQDLNYNISEVWIEDYRDRGQVYGTNPQMRQMLADFKQAMPGAKFLDNTGSRQVAKPALLRILGLDQFQTTHHQDLQAAARIMVFGLLKVTEFNQVLTKIVADHLDGQPWTIQR